MCVTRSEPGNSDTGIHFQEAYSGIFGHAEYNIQINISDPTTWSRHTDGDTRLLDKGLYIWNLMLTSLSFPTKNSL